MKRLILVGGGHAHLSVLRAVAKKRTAGVELILITPSEHQNYSGMLPGWMAGHYTEAECRIDLLPLVQAAGARLIPEQVVGMDSARRSVDLSDGRHLEYDMLSLDVGSEIDTLELEPLRGRLLPVKPLDAFFSTWPHVLAQAQRKKGYRLVVVGAGAAGVEVALAARHAFTHASVDGQVDLVASGFGILPEHSQKVQDRVLRFAGRVGLGLHFLRGVGVENGVFLSDGNVLRADRVIAATGARPQVWVKSSKLATDESGYVLVDAHHRSVSHPNVFAAGDICARQDVAMSRSGVHAVHAGPVLGENIIAALSGRSLDQYQPRRRSLYLLACGPRYAIASWGWWSAEGEWVWRWKDQIDRGFIRRFSDPERGHVDTR